jgi:hypothetical protein
VTGRAPAPAPGRGGGWGAGVSRVQRDSVAGRAYLDVQNLARRTRRPTAELLHAYVLEGFLARLTCSPEAGGLVLKGGVLLAAFAARVRFHVDVNVGDPIWPAPELVDLPRVLGGTLRITGYPLAMVYAEKIVTAVERGVANTRWRDFADVYLLSRAHDANGGEVVAALTRVAEHRQVTLSPLTTAVAGFLRLAQSRWAARRRRQLLDGLLPEDFAEVLDAVIAFADPCLRAGAAPGVWDATTRRWIPVGEPPDSPKG